ncbi:helix-turn-helix domain-containing protein [Streptomyces sp. NPDC054847]
MTPMPSPAASPTTRSCRETGCTRPPAPQRHICHGCRKRRQEERNPRPRTWFDADETDVQLIVEQPRRVEGLHRIERVLIARGLSAKQMSAERIAEVVGVSPRTVYRWRAAIPARARRTA